MCLQISDLKKEIILKKGTLHFDFTASALALKCVEKEIAKILPSYANTHSDSSLNSFKLNKFMNKHAKISKQALI